MIRRVFWSEFSSGKYFIDENFQNIVITTRNEVGYLYKISKIIADNDINMTYIKSQCSNAWT